jgi:hypothetical protein
MSAGVLMIEAERNRQIVAEGWTPEHDDQHAPGALRWKGPEMHFVRTSRFHLSTRAHKAVLSALQIGDSEQIPVELLPLAAKIAAGDWLKIRNCGVNAAFEIVTELERCGFTVAGERPWGEPSAKSYCPHCGRRVHKRAVSHVAATRAEHQREQFAKVYGMRKDGFSLGEIGKKMGLTRERARQIEYRGKREIAAGIIEEAAE